MKLNKKFLMKFISNYFGPSSSSSSKRGSSSMNAAAHHPTHPSTIEEDENHDSSSIWCGAEGDLYCPAVNYDTKRVAGEKLNRSSTSSDHHNQKHYWRPSLSVISEDKTTSVHGRSSSSPPSPSPSSGMMKKLLAGKKHGAGRRQRSTDSYECHPHDDHFEPMMPAFSPAAFMF